MGFTDQPPPHVSPYYRSVGAFLLGIGGVLYTVTYLLMVSQSIRDRTYAMPLLALSFNFAWEGILLFYIAAIPHEQVIFGFWMLIDVGLLYAVVKYGENEWKHAPVVGRNIGKILAVMVAWWTWANFAVWKWWLDGNINAKPGKFYLGVEGPDTNEMGFWTALVAQLVLSCASLAQILVRGTSGGASYSIWASRFFGSLIGLNANYLWTWWAWPEAHEYFVNPFAVCMLITWMVADVAYVYVLWDVKKTEVVLGDGRKVRAGLKHAGKAA